MAMAIEAGRDGATSTSRVAPADQGAMRERSVEVRSDRPEGTPGVRYLYDEDGRVLAEAFVGTAGN